MIKNFIDDFATLFKKFAIFLISWLTLVFVL